tara:strand:- start:799 stop:1953 length:1155 start_codon:yes stop_codon:yes gene_type:complete
MIDIYDHHAISAGEIRIARDRALAALGRLDGTVAGLGGDALAIFARRLVTACVIDALRVERHAFTDDRFAAWRAGIGTLSDGATHHQRSPSRVTRAVLGELATHSWAPLAEAAQAFHDVARPLSDGPRSPDEPNPVDDLWQAHELAAAIAPSQEPNLALTYAEAAREHVVFAPRETQLRMFGDGVYRKTYQLTPAGPPTWALGLYVGRVLKGEGMLRHALPFPGAIVAYALRRDIEDGERYLGHYTAIGQATTVLSKLADEARRAEMVIADRCSSLRGSSRAPLAAQYLAGFGALRSDQLEWVLSASRTGVHGIIATLRKAGLVQTRGMGSVKLHALATNFAADEPTGSKRAEATGGLSKKALDEFDAAMDALEGLISKDDRRD